MPPKPRIRFIYEDGLNNSLDEDGLPPVDFDDATALEVIGDENDFYETTDEEWPIPRTTESKSTPILPTVEPGRPRIRLTLNDMEQDKRLYRQSSDRLREKFFEMHIEQPHRKIAAIARELYICPRTANKWVKYYEANGEIPNLRRGRPQRLEIKDVHKKFIDNIIEARPKLKLRHYLHALEQEFQDISISKSSFHRVVTVDCRHSHKVARVDNIVRNSPTKIQERYAYVAMILSSGIDYINECIFIDEAGFKINMTNTQGWSKIGTTPVFKIPSETPVNNSVIGAITSRGIVLLSHVPRLRKRGRNNDGEAFTKGTNAGHFKQFILDLLGRLDKHEKYRNSVLVMDNASIHKNINIERMITRRGYRCQYLPSFSPELNPIENFWKEVKSPLKTEYLLSSGTLLPEIKRSAMAIPREHFRNYVQHSIDRFETCLNKQPL